MSLHSIFPDENGNPVEDAVTDEEAIRIMRRSWKQNRPGEPDLRTDAECHDEFMVVNWAIWHEE